MTLTDGSELAFEYNSDGLRTGKTVGTDKTVEYLLDGTKIIREIRKVNGTVTETLLYYYNTDGDVIGLNYNGTDYYYGRNMQGDILYIYNTSGEIVTTYAYDAWGSIVSQTGTLSSTVGEANPFRYRGYYLDSETGLYYLQSRYYDPAAGRFLNADDTENVNKTASFVSANAFAYGNNNSVIYTDESGNLAISATIVANLAVKLILISAFAVALYKLLQIISDEASKLSFRDFKAKLSIVASSIKSISRSIAAKVGALGKYSVESFDMLMATILSLAGNAHRKGRNGNKHKHHIVAKKAWQAFPARLIVLSCGIKTSYAINLILIDASLHENIHTMLYYTLVNTVFSIAYAQSTWYLERIVSVIAVYHFIRVVFLIADDYI